MPQVNDVTKSWYVHFRTCTTTVCVRVNTYYRTMRFMRMYNRAPISASSRCLGSPTSFISSPPNDMYTALHSKQA